MTMNASEPRRSTSRPANGDSSRTGSPNIAKVSPIEIEAGPEALVRNRLQMTSYVPPAK